MFWNNYTKYNFLRKGLVDIGCKNWKQEPSRNAELVSRTPHNFSQLWVTVSSFITEKFLLIIIVVCKCHAPCLRYLLLNSEYLLRKHIKAPSSTSTWVSLISTFSSTPPTQHTRFLVCNQPINLHLLGAVKQMKHFKYFLDAQ